MPAYSRRSRLKHYTQAADFPCQGFHSASIDWQFGNFCGFTGVGKISGVALFSIPLNELGSSTTGVDIKGT